MNRRSVGLGNSFDFLTKVIDAGFRSEYGPGDYPLVGKGKRVRGIIAPCFDFKVACGGYAWSYKEIAEANVPDVYLILGRGEHGFKTSLFNDWETPLGLVKVNRDFGKKLIVQFNELRNEYEPFIGDKNIEMQLPFLQFANKDREFNFVPVLVGDNVSYEDICEFADALTTLPENVCIIGSANLTYFGKEYGYVPFLHKVKENMAMVDGKLLKMINELNAKEFHKTTRRGNIRDRNVIALMLEIMRGYGLRRGNVLHYYTSGDIQGYEEAVGFGSVVFS